MITSNAAHAQNNITAVVDKALPVARFIKLVCFVINLFDVEIGACV
jgi:hypothetical protein